ncbi:radical SAM protein, partial [bacterium]|nr:radical SAM protein [bacterium]
MSDEEREFQVFVKPVGSRCNLRCSYCYYLDRGQLPGPSGGVVMNDDVLEEYIRQHISVSGGKKIYFSWHGGEPTLAGIDFYRQAVEIEKSLAQEGCNILNGIQTNGTMLDDEWGRFLSENGFHVGVSLDGPEAYHNSHRSRVGGSGSFDAAMKGLG